MKLFTAYFFTLIFGLGIFQATINLVVGEKTEIYTMNKNIESPDGDSESNKKNVEDDSELSDYFLSCSTTEIISSLPYCPKFYDTFYNGTIQSIKVPPPKI